MILRLAVEDVAEFTALHHVDAGEHLRAIAAGLGHHVFEPGGFHRLEQSLQLFHRQPRGHRADDVFALLERLHRHVDVKRRGGEQSDGLEARVLEEFGKVLVEMVAAVGLFEQLQPVLALVADGRDDRHRDAGATENSGRSRRPPRRCGPFPSWAGASAPPRRARLRPVTAGPRRRQRRRRPGNLCVSCAGDRSGAWRRPVESGCDR